MSETAVLGAVPSLFKPAGSAVLESPKLDSAAFHAVLSEVRKQPLGSEPSAVDGAAFHAVLSDLGNQSLVSEPPAAVDGAAFQPVFSALGNQPLALEPPVVDGTAFHPVFSARGSQSLVPEPPVVDGAAFQPDLFAGGFPSLQTSAQLGGPHPASLGRTDGENGNVVPLRYLNSNGILNASAAVEPEAALVDAATAQANIVTSGSVLVPAAVAATPSAPRRSIDPGQLPPVLQARRSDSLTELGGDTEALKSAIDDDFTDLDQSLLRAPTQEPTSPGRNGGGLDIEPRISMPSDGIQLASSPKLVHVPVTVDALTSPMAATHAPAPVAVNVDAPFPLHNPRFAEGFTQQVTLMASDGVQQARITLNPPDLGPVELRITVRNGEASVQLASQHAVVREALAEALPRLREQFDQAGMQLADSRVFSELPGHSAQREERGEKFDFDPPSIEPELAEQNPGQAEITVQHGFVDAYV